MATITINGKEYSVEEGTYIYDAALDAGFEIPTFCAYEGLSRIGACRMCVVEVEGQGKLVPSCVTPAMHGMKVKTDSEKVKKAREGILELFLSNHALDCPVCDKGAECELQDTVTDHFPHIGVHGEDKQKFHTKDYTLSQVIMKNSNRCVQCTRCTRVCEEIVGVGVIKDVGRGSHTEETSFMKTELDCDHCGMCIEVCPTGCFMRKPYRYKARPWDLTSAKSVCNYCGTGCTINVQERDGEVLRAVAKPGEGINSDLLCSRGRFGFDFVNNEERILKPLVKKNGKLTEASWDEALKAIKDGVGNGEKTGFIAGARLTNEELYGLQKMARNVFKSNDIDSDVRFKAETVGYFIDALEINKGGQSLEDALKSDSIFVTGSHLSDENPVTEYLIRMTSNKRSINLVIASPRAMKLDKNARTSLRHNPLQNAALLNGISAALNDKAVDKFAKDAGLSEEEIKDTAVNIKRTDSVTLMAGTDYLRYDDIDGLKAFKELVKTLRDSGKEVKVFPVLDRANTRGAWDMGVNPLFGAGYSEVTTGMDSGQMISALVEGKLSNLYIAGEDVLSLYSDYGLAEKALKKASFVVVQETFLTETAKLADVVLPANAFSEKKGTMTNQEGRVQPMEKLLNGPEDCKNDLEIISMVSEAIDGNSVCYSTRQAIKDIAAKVSAYSDASQKDAVLAKDSTNDVKLNGAANGKVQSGSGFMLLRGNHLLHSGSLTMKSEILKDLKGTATVELSKADAEKLGVDRGSKVKVKANGTTFSARVAISKGNTKEGIVFIAENYLDLQVNKLTGGNDAITRVEVSKEG